MNPIITLRIHNFTKIWTRSPKLGYLNYIKLVKHIVNSFIMFKFTLITPPAVGEAES